MSGNTVNRVYDFSEYRVTDVKDDKILFRNEVKIKVDGKSYRDLKDDEWAKFVVLPAVKANNFIAIAKPALTAENIIRALEADPATLKPIIAESGGIAYVILTLENYFAKASPTILASTNKKFKKWETEFRDHYQALPQLTDKGLDRMALPNIGRNPKLFETLRRILAISTFIFEKKGLKYELEKTLMDALNKGVCDCDKFAAMYVHFGHMMGWNIKLYKFNNHVAVIYEDSNLPGGRIIIEPTGGYIVDPDFYFKMKEPQPITCLHIGFPLSQFERPPETAVASVFLQKANDLMESGQRDEAKRYLLLVDKLQPNDPSVYMLLQIVDPKNAEMHRQRLLQMLPTPQK